MAKERLQIILAHERASRTAPDFLPALQQDIIQAITKYFPIDPEGVRVQFDRRESYAVLELNISLPAETKPGPRQSKVQSPKSAEVWTLDVAADAPHGPGGFRILNVPVYPP